MTTHYNMRHVPAYSGWMVLIYDTDQQGQLFGSTASRLFTSSSAAWDWILSQL